MSTVLCDRRLLSAASLVRQGAVFADVGTDHAYLPLFLLTRGCIRHAICTDIADGPLASARAHASGSPARERMTFVKTDGLDGIAAYAPTDIAICGMGGELIADILARAPFVKDGDVRLILQPMSRQEHLRSFLAAQGFAVIEERYSEADGKFYVTMAAQYTGHSQPLTPQQAAVGYGPQQRSDIPAYHGYLRRKQQSLLRAMDGKRRGGETTDDEQAILHAIEQILTINIDNS